MDTIVKEKEGPKSEADQALYNMLIETYGTHYITYAIVGATAHLFTLISEAYAKSSSFQEITIQITRVSRSWFRSRTYVEFIRDVQQNVTESFRKNSEYFGEYQPPVPTIPDKTEYQ